MTRFWKTKCPRDSNYNGTKKSWIVGRRNIFLVSLVGFAVLILISCRSGPHLPNRANGPPFKGRLILATENEHRGYQTIYEIKMDPTTRTAIPKVLLSDVAEFA